MAAEPSMMMWTFVSECAVPMDVQELLVPGETPVAAYKTVRDTAVITDKRLIMRDAQGLTGKKVEIYSLPWKSVDMWSSENAGHIDFNAELEFWTRAGHIKLNLRHPEVRPHRRRVRSLGSQQVRTLVVVGMRSTYPSEPHTHEVGAGAS